jgi:isopentenyl-diphosphate delta-isomerase
MTNELIEVITRDGHATGVRKPKPHIHRDGDWHRAIHVWLVVPDGRVLLQRRSLQKENNPGLWDVSVAGHVSAGETVMETALREVEEEIGLRIEQHELQFIGRTTTAAILNGGKYLDNELHEVFLVCRDIDLTTLMLQAGEVDDVALVDPRELLDRTDVVPHREEYQLLLRALAAPAFVAPLPAARGEGGRRPGEG